MSAAAASPSSLTVEEALENVFELGKQQTQTVLKKQATTASTTLEDNTDIDADVDASTGTNVEQECEWAQKAHDLYNDDKLLEAARVLRSANAIVNVDTYTEEQRRILHLATKLETLVETLEGGDHHDHDHDGQGNNSGAEVDEEWIKIGGGSGESGSSNSSSNNKKTLVGDTTIHYKASDKHTRLEIRVETPVDKSLLVPILAVLNETQLYKTWLPSWRMPPKFGIRRVQKLSQKGRCSQILLATFDPPWPLSPREIVLRAVAADDIGDRGDILVHIQSINEADEDDGNVVPPVDDPNIQRLEFTGGFLFRRMQVTDTDVSQAQDSNNDNDNDNDKIMVKFYVDLHSGALGKVPHWLTHMFVKQVFWTSWNIFLRVAQDIPQHKRPQHESAIQSKQETLYKWVEERTQDMLLYEQTQEKAAQQQQQE